MYNYRNSESHQENIEIEQLGENKWVNRAIDIFGIVVCIGIPLFMVWRG